MVAKYPKEVGTPEQWPRGTDICYTLGCIMNTVSEDSIQPTHSLWVTVKVYFWTYFKYPSGISGVPPRLILIHSRQSQNIHSKHMQVLRLFYDSIFKALVLCLNLLIYVLCLNVVFYCAYFSSCHLWLFMVNFKLPSIYLNLMSSY